MLGPLPPLHKSVIVVAALLVCAGIGLWIGVLPEIPLNVRAGLLTGTGVGVAAAFALINDSRSRRPYEAPSRRRLP